MGSTLRNLTDGVAAKDAVAIDQLIPSILAAFPDIPTIAALKAYDVTLVPKGQPFWVDTKKAPYFLDTAAATVAGDDNFYVAPTVGPGMWARELCPVPEWQTKATNGTGIFIDPVVGNDENLGDIGTPIKTMREFNARVFGAEFTISPRLTVLGAGSTNAQDAVIAGWSTSAAAPLILVGSQTVVAGGAGVVLSAAGNLNAAVSAGFLTSVITDFLTLGLVSNAARCLFARRVNAAPANTTFAALFRTHNAGPNFSVDISPQVQVPNPGTNFAIATTQQFAAGDIVDLVQNPVWPGIRAAAEISVTPVFLDFPTSANITGGGLINLTVCGTRGTFNTNASSNTGSSSGCQHNGTIVIGAATNFGFNFPNFGAQGLAAMTLNVQGRSVLNTFTGDGATLQANGGKILFTNGTAWIQNSPLVANLLSAGQLIISAGHTIGVGAAVVLGATTVDGGQLVGAGNFSVAVNPFTSGTPWSIAGVSVATGALGIFDAATLSAIVL